jgi:hypothetical protein
MVAANSPGQSQVDRRASPPTRNSVALWFNEAFPFMEFALFAAIEGGDRTEITHHARPDFAKLPFFRREDVFRVLVNSVRNGLHGSFLSLCGCE